jgi:2-polyprenyl-3-methyl-5-hydroxy-6-metoxy-1,4-benzoquinol methylase
MFDSMDLMAEAIQDKMCGVKEKFFFIGKDGIQFEHKIDRYFKTPFPATKLEKQLFQLCQGSVLDIGSATGNYFSMIKTNNLTGIESNNKLVQIAKDNHIQNIRCEDIFKYKNDKKFDTIILLENNIGLGGNITKTKSLIQKISNLLKSNGKVLAIISARAKQDFYISELTGHYKKKIGNKINWLNISPNYLSQLCQKFHLKSKIINNDAENYLIEITKIN